MSDYTLEEKLSAIVLAWVSTETEYLRRATLCLGDPDGPYARTVDLIAAQIYADFKHDLQRAHVAMNVHKQPPLMGDLLDAVWETLDVEEIAMGIVDEAAAALRTEAEVASGIEAAKGAE